MSQGLVDGSGADAAIEVKRTKLIEAKQRWAREGRLLTGTAADREDAVPPGQKVVRDWPVLDLGRQPDISPKRFRLDVAGLVSRPLHLGYAELMALPQTDTVSDMHCVTQWSRLDNRWRGISGRALMRAAGVLPGVRFVLFQAQDGYTTNVRLDQFAQPDVLLVHQWDGQPITREHGGPIRVMMPSLYLWKSAKWISRIEFSAEDRPGFWEVRGYHNNADPWAEERYG